MSSQPYVGEIECFGFDWAPAGWKLCNGQLLSILEYETLWNLIGTMYGGDGEETFAVPNLSGRIPIHTGSASGGQTRNLAEAAGTEVVPLTVPQMPSHRHPQGASAAEWTTNRPAGAVPARGGAYGAPDATLLDLATVSPAGASQTHENMPPFLVLSFCIAVEGIFPPTP